MAHLKWLLVVVPFVLLTSSPFQTEDVRQVCLGLFGRKHDGGGVTDADRALMQEIYSNTEEILAKLNAPFSYSQPPVSPFPPGIVPPSSAGPVYPQPPVSSGGAGTVPAPDGPSTTTPVAPGITPPPSVSPSKQAAQGTWRSAPSAKGKPIRVEVTNQENPRGNSR